MGPASRASESAERHWLEAEHELRAAATSDSLIAKVYQRALLGNLPPRFALISEFYYLTVPRPSGRVDSVGLASGDGRFLDMLAVLGRRGLPGANQKAEGSRRIQFGSSGRIRTYNPSVNSRMLYH